LKYLIVKSSKFVVSMGKLLHGVKRRGRVPLIGIIPLSGKEDHVNVIGTESATLRSRGGKTVIPRNDK